MNIERRNETQTPAGSSPVSVPSLFLQRYGTRLLLGVTLIVLCVVIFRYRSISNQRRATAARDALMRARTEINQLRAVLRYPAADPAPVVAQRKSLETQILAQLGEVFADSDAADTALRAAAYCTRGDVFWILANAPTYPQAVATRPFLAMGESTDDHLKNADSDYKTVVSDYANFQTDWATAVFGLAAIAENRHDWDEAARRYQSVLKRGDAADGFKEMAQIRLSMLAQIRTPLQLGAMTTQPTTMATTMSTTMATTQPTTMSTMQPTGVSANAATVARRMPAAKATATTVPAATTTATTATATTMTATTMPATTMTAR